MASPGSSGKWLGSPVSGVEPTLVPVTKLEQPLITCADRKLSLAGGDGVGVGVGVGPPTPLQPISNNSGNVRSCGGWTLWGRLLLMFGSISWFGVSVVSKWETDDPGSTGFGVYTRAWFDPSAPKLNTPGTAEVTWEPTQTKLPVLIAELTRSLSVIAGQSLPVVLSRRNWS